MKVNKKTVLSTATVLGVAALVAGGTIAYFTDQADPVTNTFTVGDVKIEMYESQLHRENSGYQGIVSALPSDPNYCDYTNFPQAGVNYNGLQANTYNNVRYCTPGMDANNTQGLSAVENGHTRTGFNNANRTWGYSDETIIRDAEGYKAGADTATTDDDGYFTTVSKDLVPGQWVRKFTYVKNADNENANYDGSDAYVLIRYMVPEADADKIDLKIPGTPYEEDVDANEDGVQPYFYAVYGNANATTKYTKYELTANGIDDYEGYTEIIGGATYRVFAAVTRQPIKSGEMTFWSPVNTIRIKPSAQNSDPNGANYISSDAILNVVVDAQAIQAKTFGGALEAINQL